MQTASEPRITEIDIGGPARALAMLRWSDFVLVVMCGLAGLAMVPDVVFAAGEGRWADAVAAGAEVACCVLGSDALVSFGSFGPDAVVIAPQLPDLASVQVVAAIAIEVTHELDGVGRQRL